MGASLLHTEEHALRTFLTTIDDLEAALAKIPRDPRTHEARTALIAVINRLIAQQPPVRPAVAAALLNLGEKTVRRWIDEGILTTTQATPTRRAVDLARLLRIRRLVADLRRTGHGHRLTEAVWRRLYDQGALTTPAAQIDHPVVRLEHRLALSAAS